MTTLDGNVFSIGDSGEVTVEVQNGALKISYSGSPSHSIYVAIDSDAGIGSYIAPFEIGWEGSTVFLPFPAKLLYSVIEGVPFFRTWSDYTWRERRPLSATAFSVDADGSRSRLIIPLDNPDTAKIVFYVKDLAQNSGWGNLLGSSDPNVLPGFGDKTIHSFLQITRDSGRTIYHSARRSESASRIRIYELFVRLFGNFNGTRKQNGSLAENGCGKFSDINEAALQSIADMNFTHIWLLGVIRHACTTPYPEVNLEADESDLMKGLAGSPFAVKDYFDVAPDLASNPARRMDEFSELLERIHSHGLKVLIDLVPNHVSRAYASTMRPHHDFGVDDDRRNFFDASNNFFYLQETDEGNGPPLRLPTFDRQTQEPVSPTCQVRGDCDGLFAGEETFGRVTGNNRITWTPALWDWYETVKLNYGFDFRNVAEERRHFPHAGSPDTPIPGTWRKMDSAIEYWQHLGVDGFRCDMAHMIPPEFWAWATARARTRNPEVFFMAEAYNDFLVIPTADPTVLRLGENPLFPALLNAGFNAVYGHDAYSVIKRILSGTNWANDIDGTLGAEFIASNSVCYSENHDEVRLASRLVWGGWGPNIGRPVSAILFGLNRGPILLYNGQEVGEPAEGAEGFGGDDGRTTIFDYWSMPEFSKWVNEHRYDGAALSDEQRELRLYYKRLLGLCGEPAFRDGHFFPLNPANLNNEHYGRLPGETVSGHWLYSCLRYDPQSQQRFLIVANLYGNGALENVQIYFSDDALQLLNLSGTTTVRLVELLAGAPQEIQAPISDGVSIPVIPALTAFYFSLTPVSVN